jgi:hypothetical protein
MNPYFLAFELFVTALFAVCLWSAARQGRFAALELLWMALFGFLLEWLTIKQLSAYYYGPFAVMIDGAPLAVALGWAVIIYASMHFSDRVRLPDTVRPLLDALLALNIDIALDVVAVRLGMWVWVGVGRGEQWFGVPWANFWAWFLVVWSFSMFLRALRPWRAYRVRRWLYAPLAMTLALVALVIASSLFYLLTDLHAEALASLFVLAASLWIVLSHRPRLRAGQFGSVIVVLVPLAFHLFALFSGALEGIFSREPWLGAIGVAMLVVSLLLHGGAWWAGRTPD